MPSQYPVLMLPPLKGLNKRDNPERLQWGELVTATNILINEDGSGERIKGYTDLLASNIGVSFCTSFVDFERWDGSYDYFFEYNGTLYQLYQPDPTSWTYRTILSGLVAGARIGYVSYNDYLYLGNGLDENKKIVPIYRHFINRAAITTADASNEATAVALANALKTDYNLHRVSTTQHNSADSTNAVTTANATDYAGALALANEIKADYNAHRSQDGIHISDDGYHLVEHANATNDATTLTLLNEIKLVYNQHIEDGRALKWSITAPTTLPTLAITSGSGLEEGAYNYVYTFYNLVDGTESAPSPLASVTTTATDERVNLSVMDQSTDPQATHKRIYRTVVAGAIYYKVAEITNKNTTYADTTADASLGVALQTEDLTVIPNTNIFLLYNDRIYMAGDYANPFRMYFTEALYPERYNAGFNFFDADDSVRGLAKTDVGIFLFERNKTWLYAGTSPFNFSRLQKSNIFGCTNPNGVTYIEGMPVWISDYGVKMWSGAMINNLSDLIDDDLLTKNLNSASLVYDAFNKRLRVILASA